MPQSQTAALPRHQEEEETDKSKQAQIEQTYEPDIPCLSKQCRAEEANWSGSALFVIKYVNFYQKPGSSNLIGWKLDVGVAS